MTMDVVCPKCETAMLDGFVLDRGEAGFRQPAVWVEGAPEPSFWSGLKVSDREVYSIQTFRCPNCRHLESYASERIYI